MNGTNCVSKIFINYFRHSDWLLKTFNSIWKVTHANMFYKKKSENSLIFVTTFPVTQKYWMEISLHFGIRIFDRTLNYSRHMCIRRGQWKISVFHYPVICAAWLTWFSPRAVAVGFHFKSYPWLLVVVIVWNLIRIIRMTNINFRNKSSWINLFFLLPQIRNDCICSVGRSCYNWNVFIFPVNFSYS